MPDEAWRTDPLSLRDVVLDRTEMQSRLDEAPPVERVWILALLDRFDEAEREVQAILRERGERYATLLLLAYVRLRQFRWWEAAELQEAALRRARTPAREAQVRYEIGRRFFEEGRYQAAADEFQWAYDLRRTSGSGYELLASSREAMARARTLAARGWA